MFYSFLFWLKLKKINLYSFLILDRYFCLKIMNRRYFFFKFFIFCNILIILTNFFLLKLKNGDLHRN